MVNSQCLRSIVKLVCVLKSLRRNVTMQVLFPAAVISSGSLIFSGQIVHIKEGKGKLALFYTANNVLLIPLLFIFYFPPPAQFSYFSPSIFYSLLHNFTTFYYYRSSILNSPFLHNFIIFPPLPPHLFYKFFPSTNTSTSYRPYINLASTPHRLYINPTSTLDNFFFQHSLVNSETIYNHNHIFPSFIFFLLSPPQLCYFRSWLCLFPPPHFYCFPSSSNFTCNCLKCYTGSHRQTDVLPWRKK